MDEKINFIDMKLVCFSCDNKKCEKNGHLIFAAMIKSKEIIKIICPSCNCKYEIISD